MRNATAAGVWVLAAAAHAVAAHAADDAPPDGARAAVGPGVYLTSSYPGARSTRSELLPFIDAEYGQRYYSSANDLFGIYAMKTADTQAGAAVTYDLTERRARDDERFRNLRDLDETPRFKLFASHTVSFLTGDANVATDMAGRGEGTLVQANLWATLPLLPTLSLSGGPGVTWANARYTRAFFGITAAQAAVSPFSPHAAPAGVIDLHWNGFETYDISSRWSVGASQSAARLRGSAGDSPVTSRREQIVAFAWLAYKLK
jgi:outer membrane protein